MQIPQFYFHEIILYLLNSPVEHWTGQASNQVTALNVNPIQIQGKVIEIKVELRISKHIYQNLFSPIAIIFPMIGNCFQ